MRRLVVVLALVASVLVLAPAVDAAPTVVRRAGSDRYATAVEVSKASAQPGVSQVIVASGASFADALAAAPGGKPVLLVPGTSIPAVVAAELDRLNPGKIIVLGGTGAVSDGVATQLKQYSATVERIAGADRYATAAALSAAGFQPGVRTAYVVGGESEPDALSAGAGAVNHGPVLLVTPSAIPKATADELTRLKPGNIVIVGGTTAVSDAVAVQLESFTIGSLTRRAGADRFATSAVASLGEFAPPTADLYLASGRSTADALAGAWAAGANDSPVLLTERTCVPARVLQEIERLQPQRVVLLGGTSVLADSVGALTPCGALQATVIATGLEVPWDVAFLANGDAYLTERRSGRLLLRKAGGAITEVQKLPSVDFGEGGLLGLAIKDGVLYAYFTSATDNRIVRFAPGGTPTPILTGIARATNHNAGRIAFGPDGMLYAGTGDAGVSSRSQDPASLNGKILRIKPDGGVPADNPRPGSYVYALGFRDPQGLAWDAQGRLYASEFGPDKDDEVNRVVANGNYGWPTVTGVANDARFVDPIVVRPTAVASWSGATVVRGGVPEWDGDLLVAALRGTRLYRFDLSAAGTVIGTGEELYTGQYGRLRHVEQAPDGSLWVLTSNRDGRGSPVAADDRIIRIGH
ncbi:MAG: oxidoreductase [Actinomycetia bacterium]|nr:oxidoreductase [Actinomycetes bacterium]